MTSVPVTFECSGKIDQLEPGPYNLLKGASVNQFGAQPIAIPATYQEFQVYEEYMNSPFIENIIEDFKYQFILLGDYLQDQRLDSLVDWYRQQILKGQVRLPLDLPKNYLKILFRDQDQTHFPSGLAQLLEQENFRLSWDRDQFQLYPYFIVKENFCFEWKIPLLSVSYEIENFHFSHPDRNYEWSDLSTFKVEYLDWAIIYGLLEVVKYIVQTMMNQEDIRRNRHKLRLAIQYGYFDIAKYLIEAFNLTKSNSQSLIHVSFTEAATRGRLEITQYLSEYFKLTKAELLNNPSIIWENFNLPTLEVLNNSIIFPKCSLGYSLLCLARNGRLKLVRYLVEYFDLGPYDFPIDTIDYIIKETECKHHREVADYLRFYLTYMGWISNDLPEFELLQIPGRIIL